MGRDGTRLAPKPVAPQVGRGVPHLAPWFVRENKWRTARYGLDARVITPDGQVPLREELARWLHILAPHAERLGCSEALHVAERVMAVGTSAERQRAVASASGGDLRGVVDALLDETKGSL